VNSEVFEAFYFVYCLVMKTQQWPVEGDLFSWVLWVALGALADMEDGKFGDLESRVVR
jgi:hypothetical protein